MPINAELVAACLEPITAESPAGTDIRYDARLNEIKEARREEHLPGAERKVADWGAVITTCGKLLQKESKDLQLAAWLTEALLRRSSFAGLATGLNITRGLVEQYWETVYPLPEDDDLELRLGPIEWIGTRLDVPVRLSAVIGRFSCVDLETARDVPTEIDARSDTSKGKLRNNAIEAGKPTPEEIEADSAAMTKVHVRATLADLSLAVQEIDLLQAVADEKFGRDGPSFRSLTAALEEPRRVLAQLLAKRLEEDPDPIEEVADDAADGALAVDPDAPQTPEPVSAADAAQRLGVVAKWLRQQQRNSPAPYLMLRAFRWGELVAQAPELEPRLLEAPPTVTRTRLRGLFLDGKWAELLEQGEVLMALSAGRGWLDLQRYAVTACEQLGGDYDAVARGIRSELRTLLRALPQLPRLTLMDETPTANDETREWLDSAILPEDGATDAVVSSAEDALPSDGSELLAEALDDDARTAHQGGLSRSRAAHPSARPAGRDLFVVARSELAQGRPQRAIELLISELAREQSVRGRFVRQTQIAFIMVEAGMDQVALPILQQLVEQIDNQKLDQWESGPLVAQPLALLHRVLGRTNGDQRTREGLYLRVCRLDPIQALALQP